MPSRRTVDFLKFATALIGAFMCACFIVIGATHAQSTPEQTPAAMKQQIAELQAKNRELGKAATVALSSLKEANAALKEALKEVDDCHARRR